MTAGSLIKNMQQDIWDQEYKNKKFVTGDDKPQAFFLRLIKELKKKHKVDFEKIKVLDLGCGTGRNSNYLASLGADVIGIDFSNAALKIAKQRAAKNNLKVKYLLQSIGEVLPFDKNEFDLVLDITSSNSLNEQERAVYLNEVKRVLKKNGYFFVRALCLDGDKNAKKLLKLYPGKEQYTYVMPEVEIAERVFTREDFIKTYAKNFKILKLEKTTSYSRFGRQRFKRNFWLCLMKG